MHRLKSHRSITLFFFMLALLVPALLSPRPFAGRALAMPQFGQTGGTSSERTDCDMFSLNPSNGAVSGKAGGADWAGSVPGYNIIRIFKNNDNVSVLFLLNSNTGKAEARQIEAGGGLGGITWETSGGGSTALRCTAADIAKVGSTTYLITHDSFTGKVRKFPMNDNGSPGFNTMTEFTKSSLRDKNLFNVYYFEGSYLLVAADTWTGSAVGYTLDGTQLYGQTWTLGWTHIDHLAVGGVTYRLLYKSAGDPYIRPGEANDQRGRFAIQTIKANGVEGQTIYDETMPEAYTSVRFASRPNGQGGTQHMIFFYNRDAGFYYVRDFAYQDGVGAVTAFGLIKPDPSSSDTLPYVDFEPLTISSQPYLAFVSPDKAEPFMLDEAEKMGDVIHDEMADKAVGYQFMLAQSGQVIYSRAWGRKRLDAAGDMSSRTRMDIGSVSKLITTTTMMWLAAFGNGFGNVNVLESPITSYLPASEFVPNTWAGGKTIADLLKHTTGMQAEDDVADQCKEVAGTDNDPQTTCADYFSAEQTVACSPAGCKRVYNNANIGAVREVIEFMTSTSTTQEIVAKTRELWADGVNLGGLTCEHPADVKYFARCTGGDCYDYNDKSWSQVDLEGWSGSCAAGGWRASSREMIEFLLALRYQKILPAEFNAEFLRTDLVDAYGGRTAIGWDTPWDAKPGNGADYQLGKNGKNPKGEAAMVAYITRLPNQTDAVLLVNTDVPGVDGLVQDTYLYSKGLQTSPPNYLQIPMVGKDDDGNQVIDRLAMGTVASGAPDADAVNAHYITAARDRTSQQLKLVGWYVTADGHVEREGDAVVSGAINDVAITDGEAFVTAVRDSSDNLKVTSWTVTTGNDTIDSHQSTLGDKATKVAAAKLAGSGDFQGRAVTATRTGGKLQLDVWDFDNAVQSLTREGKWIAGNVSEVAVRTLQYQNDLDDTSRFVTAVRNGSGKLQVDVWDVNHAGQIERLGGEVTTFSVSSAASSVSKIAIDSWGLNKFHVAFLDGDSKLKLVTWQVTADGLTVTRKDDFTSGNTRSEVALTRTTVVARDSAGKLDVLWFVINGANGEITYRGNTTGGAVKMVAAGGRVLTAVRLDDDKLKLINWDIVD